jgi:hypothetical protein
MRHTVGNTDEYVDIDCNSNRHTNVHADGDTDCDTDSDCNAHTDGYAHRDASGNIGTVRFDHV